MKQLNSKNVSTNLQRQREANRKEEELEDGEGWRSFQYWSKTIKLARRMARIKS